MKKFKQLALFFAVAIITGCANKKPYGKPIADPEFILSNGTHLTEYWYSFLNLGLDFTALDTTGKEITKSEFLQKIGTGKYLPLRLNSDTASYFYKLYPIKQHLNDLALYTIMGFGNETYKKYLWEGKELPEINFKDLNGNLYNRQTMQGKTVVFDFWYIGCTACVREMPKLNRLADSLKNKDILFASFTFDKEGALRNFLKKTEFHFAVISDTSALLIKKLGIRAFPTKVIVGKEGKIIKILDDQYHDWRI